VERITDNKASRNHPEIIETRTPTWEDTPPDQLPDQTFSLRRVGTIPITGYFTSEMTAGIQTHFWRGRTRPHYDPGPCDACTEGNSPRWHGYFAAFDEKTKSHWIQEFTLAAWEGIKSGITAFGNLRGHAFELRRTKPAANAPIRAIVYNGQLDLRLLPPAPDLRTIMYRIWQIQPAPTEQPPTTDRMQLFLHPNGKGKSQ
jgi:hypothetical protein